MNPTRCITAAFAALCAAHAAWAIINGEDWTGGGDNTLYSNTSNWQGGRATDSTAAVRFEGQEDKTVTFDNNYSTAKYLWIGSTDSKYIHDDTTIHPLVWQATSPTFGLAQTGDNFLIADASNQRGALYIKSGTYSTAGSLLVAGRANGSATAGTGRLEIDDGVSFTTGDFNIGVFGGSGTFIMNGGAMTVNGSMTWGHNANGTCVAEIKGGTITQNLSKTFTVGTDGFSSSTVTITNGTIITGDAYLGNSSAEGAVATININEGGVLSCGTTETAKWIRTGNGGTCTSIININRGGTIKAWHFQQVSTAQCRINFNGGKLVVLGSDDRWCKYIFGDTDSKGQDAYQVITVGTEGGILDTNGNDVRINISIGGEGTLTITGGGTVTFEAKPTCPVKVEEGTIVVTSATTPNSLTFEANGFVKFDLSTITQNVTGNGDGTSTTNAPSTVQTLASGVTITVPEGDTVPEHVIVKNDGTLAWEVSYEATSLTATAQLASEATPTMTIWTGDYSEAYAPRSNNSETKWGSVKNWTSGFPRANTKIIIPGNEAIYLDVDNGRTQCGDVLLRSSGKTRFFARDSKVHPWQAFAPKSVNGNGTMSLGGMNIDIPDVGPACVINTPLEIEYIDRYNGSDWSYFTVNLVSYSSSYPVMLNKTVTVPENVPLTIGANVIINGDMVIDGTNTFTTTQEIKTGLSGSGVINGSFTTAAGAKICATVTSAAGETSYLTVNGAADLSNATVEVAGGELLADAAYATEIILLRATDTITWTTKSYVIPGQAKAWTIKTGTKDFTEDDGNGGTTTVNYKVLKAVKTHPGFIIKIAGTPTAIDDDALKTWLTSSSVTTLEEDDLVKTNENKISPIAAYMLGYSSYSGETPAPALTAAATAEGWTLAYDLTGKTSPAPTVSGIALKYSIEGSDNLSDWVTVSEATTLAFASAKTYNRLVANIVAATP